MATRIMTPEERAKRSASAKARLKADPVAYEQFKARTAAAVKRQWEDDQTARMQNISASKKAANAALTAEERRQKFGWMNAEHVTPEQKRAVWEVSLGKWHQEHPEQSNEMRVHARNERWKDHVKKVKPLPKRDYGAVHSDDVEAFLAQHGFVPPWTSDELSTIFEVDDGSQR